MKIRRPDPPHVCADRLWSRRAFLASSCAALTAAGICAPRLRASASGAPRPTRSQLAWQQDELAMFVHFGVNTFTDREWGDGRENPAIFDPVRLDTRQWAATARAAGFKAMILTAKHHDGFCLWPTATTRHSVASSPFRNGAGDVVREFVDACRAEGLKPGLYLSPWDRHEPCYGDSPRYNDFYAAQLTELLTQYGPIHEVWFDGANGEGPNGRRQQYDWPRVWSLVRRLQPDAVMFSDAGPDVRWIGNERGVAGDTNWSTVVPEAVPFPGATGEGVERMLQQGDPAGSVWRPGETDVSIRKGWFYHPAEDATVRSVDNLVSLYCTSVGRNSKLLLNVPPTRDGLIHDVDVSRLTGMRAALNRQFASNLLAGQPVAWAVAGPRSGRAIVNLSSPTPVSIIELREPIEHGQVVAAYVVEGRRGTTWVPLSTGTTVGYKKLDRVTPTVVSALRITIDDALAPPPQLTIAAY